MAKTPGLKRPKFGGKPKTGFKEPDKKILDSYGGKRPRGSTFEPPGAANQEIGFFQATPKQATGAMMGRAPPPLIARSGAVSGPASKKSKKQFKARGAKVF